MQLDYSNLWLLRNTIFAPDPNSMEIYNTPYITRGYNSV